MTYQLLPKIHSPRDVRRLRETCLPRLAEEIRAAIIDITLARGGHLASNLGMVECTIAMHRVFDCPRDAILFDVSHQAYAHKLLTGRWNRFDSLRSYGGLSGFTKREESPYDATTAGHSGSALSAAIGIAEAKRLAGDDGWTVVVIGDGSFTNGMIYEAINQLAMRRLRLIVVLNDNEMSISKNVGGLSRYLAEIRTSEGYFNFKYHAKRAMMRLPTVGDSLVAASRHTRDFIKRVTGSETWFESFGMEYLGPADGNDLSRLIHVFEEAKTKDCPVVVHIRTKKGRGYAPSEAHPERFHGVSPKKMTASTEQSPSRTFADVVGETLCRTATQNPALCAITAAMTDGCGLRDFAERFPRRFFDVGIAEEHAIAAAGGMAIGGLSPVVVLYSTFAQRTFDQAWHDVALQGVHTTLLLSHAGLVPGDGVTHQGVFDIALFAPIPGTTIYSPDDFAAWQDAFRMAQGDGNLAVVRYPKGTEARYPADLAWEASPSGYKIGRIGDENASRNLVILTYGRITENVVAAAARLCAENTEIAVTVVCMNQIVPLPIDAPLLAHIRQADDVAVVEEHTRIGGVGMMLASDARVRAALGDRAFPIRAIENPTVPCGERADLEKHTHLDPDSLLMWMREIAD